MCHGLLFFQLEISFSVFLCLPDKDFDGQTVASLTTWELAIFSVCTAYLFYRVLLLPGTLYSAEVGCAHSSNSLLKILYPHQYRFGENTCKQKVDNERMGR